jgi:hypothetical protein
LVAGFLLTLGALFGGVSGFSAVLLADEVVGLIILARKESSAGGGWCGKLVLDACFLIAAGGGPRDGLLEPLFKVEGFRAGAPLALLGERDAA